MYAYRTVATEKNEKHTAKGISKSVELAFNDEYNSFLRGARGLFFRSYHVSYHH